MCTSFHHQPEAQHPKYSANHNRRPITPSYEGQSGRAADSVGGQDLTHKRFGWIRDQARLGRALFIETTGPRDHRSSREKASGPVLIHSALGAHFEIC